jgi:hypothetical protein
MTQEQEIRVKSLEIATLMLGVNEITSEKKLFTGIYETIPDSYLKRAAAIEKYILEAPGR